MSYNYITYICSSEQGISSIKKREVMIKEADNENVRLKAQSLRFRVSIRMSSIPGMGGTIIEQYLNSNKTRYP